MARTFRRNKKWLIENNCGKFNDNVYLKRMVGERRRHYFSFEDDVREYGGRTPDECYRRKVAWFISDSPRMLYYGEGIRTIVVNQMATRRNRQQCRSALRQVKDMETAETVDFKQAPKQVAWKLFAWY